MSPKELNKEEFIKLMCQKVEEKDDYLTQKEATDMLNLVLECLTDTVATGKGTNFIGFGKFSIKERAARKGRNPQTGEEIKIPGKNIVTFRPGKNLSDSVPQKM
ncbi:HU family DNA-binding protein [Vagococcus fluvialis]|jgi:DNA-binding protein HU-beta|uniref:HU family DNA-binding protein n=1 Tax=Vagococcus fluvialis TaxID=2738 RepID=UPI003B5BDC25